MTDTASLLLSELTAPSDRDEREEWLEARSAWLAEQMTRELTGLATAAVESYARGLTAAGDLAAFDGFSAVWRSFTTEVVGEYAAGMYLSGALTAWTSGPGTDGLSPEEELSWAAVVNEEAVAYQAAAVNLVVGAGEELWDEIRTETVTALSDGIANEQLKDSIQRVSGFTEERADRIARTETMRAYNSGDMVGARSLPEPHRPVEKVWIATRDSRTRRQHANADDQVVGLDAPFIVGGERLDRPADPRGSPGNTINCRCVMAMLYPGDERPDGSIVGEDAEAEPDGVPGIDQWEPTDDPDVLAARARLLPERQSFNEQVVMSRYVEVDDRGREFHGTFEHDQVLADIAERSGADGLPTVLDSADFDEAAGTVMSRGFGNQRAADQFVSGDYAPGIGLHGNGYYASDAVATAEQYASSAGRSGNALRLGLSADARVIDSRALDRLVEEAGITGPLAEDPTRYALLAGYDAVAKKRGGEETWYILLNRARVLVDGGSL